MKIAFLDRDGTIMHDYPDNVWSRIETPNFFSDTFSALKNIQDKGYKIIVITNQYIIGEKIITKEQYKNFTTLYIEILKKHYIDIFDIFYCPHSREMNCKCCKHNTGMIKEAINKHNNIEISKSFLAGDSKCDENLAKSLNINFFNVNYQNLKKPITKLSDIIPYI